MVIIGLGTVTIVAMILWFLASVIGKFTALKGAKAGIVLMYGVAVAWTFGGIF